MLQITAFLPAMQNQEKKRLLLLQLVIISGTHRLL